MYAYIQSNENYLVLLHNSSYYLSIIEKLFRHMLTFDRPRLPSRYLVLGHHLIFKDCPLSIPIIKTFNMTEFLLTTNLVHTCLIYGLWFNSSLDI